MLSASVAGVAAVFDCVCIVVMGQRSASVAGVAAVFYDRVYLISFVWGKNNLLKKVKKRTLYRVMFKLFLIALCCLSCSCLHM